MRITLEEALKQGTPEFFKGASKVCVIVENTLHAWVYVLHGSAFSFLCHHDKLKEPIADIRNSIEDQLYLAGYADDQAS
jgi:hypothetical protein